MTVSILSATQKILLVIFLSGLIGLEREHKQKGAGLRTHILVGVSATLVVLTSLYVSDIYKSADVTRLLHGIITGIGFLCAGTIIRGGGGKHISGLTTAASLWTVACIGMAVGSGLFSISIIFTLIVIVVLIGTRRIERWIIKHQEDTHDSF